jgi:hypothetical protein
MSYYFDKFNIETCQFSPLLILILMTLSFFCGAYHMGGAMEKEALKTGAGYYDKETGDFKFIEVLK